MNRSIEAREISEVELKEVVTETLRNIARQDGCASILTAIFRSNIPPEEALVLLENNNNWTLAIKEIFEAGLIWTSSFREHLVQVPETTLLTQEYHKELEESKGIKMVRFYSCLWSLITEYKSQKDIASALSGIKLHERLPLPHDMSVLYIANFKYVSRYFAIPNSHLERLDLLKQLGPQIFKNWKTNA